MPVQSVPDPQQALEVPSPPLVSVVITPVNRGRYEQQALDSIGSPAVPIETIVVEKVDEDVGGLARARNNGLARCLGQYIVFLDSEDKLAPGALELGAVTLEEHPDVAFVFGRCIGIDADGTLLPGDIRPRLTRDHYRELLKENYISMSAMVMFRREALHRAAGFVEIAPVASEYDLYLRISRHYRVHDHGQVVAFCRTNSDDGTDAGLLLRETLEVLRKERAFLEADPASLEAYTSGWTMWQNRYEPLVADQIRAAVHNRDWLSVLRNTATLLRYHPRGAWHHARRWTRLPHRYGGRAMPASH